MLTNAWSKVQLNNYNDDSCSCVDSTTHPRCTLDDLSAAIEQDNDYYKTYKWLLGYNEAYDAPFSPEAAAQVWGEYLMPLAAKYGLKLVSPTFNVGHPEWDSGFLKACVDLADHPEYPCDY